MSAAPVEVIAAAAGLGEVPACPGGTESTRRLAVAAHLGGGAVLHAWDGAGAQLPEPDVDLGRVAAELRIAARREGWRRILLVAAAAVLIGPRPADPRAWLAAWGAFFLIEAAFAVARTGYVRRRLAPGAFRGADRGSGREGEAEPGPGRVIVGTPREPFPGTGRELSSVIAAADLGRPRDRARMPRHLRVADLEHEVVVAVRRLWLSRLSVGERSYSDRLGGPARRFLALELPVGDEGGLLTTLVRFAREGDALLVEARLRFLPPVSRAFRTDDSLHPRRAAGGLTRDIAVSLSRSGLSWIGALGWIGSGVVRPAIAAMGRRDGVQERSLRERFGARELSPALETEVRQLAAVIRGRVVDGIVDSLARRGICPGPVQACAIRGDVSVAEERPARAPRSRARRPPRRRAPARRRR